MVWHLIFWRRGIISRTLKTLNLLFLTDFLVIISMVWLAFMITVPNMITTCTFLIHLVIFATISTFPWISIYFSFLSGLFSFKFAENFSQFWIKNWPDAIILAEFPSLSRRNLTKSYLWAFVASCQLLFSTVF